MARETSATEGGALSSLTGHHVSLQGTKAAAHCCDARRKHGARVRLSGLSAVARRSWQPSGPTFPPTGSTRSAPSSPDSPEVRLCVSVTGTHNLVLSVRQRSLADIQRLDAALARRFPDLRVAERRVSLRTAKRMGRILDADGRADRAVPVDVWRDPTPASCRQRPFRPPCARETSGNRTGCSLLPPGGPAGASARHHPAAPARPRPWLICHRRAAWRVTPSCARLASAARRTARTSAAACARIPSSAAPAVRA